MCVFVSFTKSTIFKNTNFVDKLPKDLELDFGCKSFLKIINTDFPNKNTENIQIIRRRIPEKM